MKEMIEKHLAGVAEGTAKEISKEIGMPPLEVSRELSRMVSTGAAERGKRDGSSEYHYWLTSPKKLSDVPAAELPMVTNEPVYVDPPLAPESQYVIPKTVLNEILVVFGIASDAADPIPQFVDKARALQTELDASVRANAEILGKLRASESALRILEADIERNGEVVRLNQQVTKLKANNAELELRIDQLTIVDAEMPSLYVTVGRYSPARRHGSLDKARRRAGALVRNEKESEVLVLAPVGRVLRGTEWRPV